MRRTGPFAAVVALAVGAAGCSGQPRGAGDGKAPVYPVEGKLVVSGRSAGNARLALHPVEKTGAAGVACPVGLTRADGTFRLTTYAADDGAPAGEYVVTLIWPNDAVPVDECECPDPVTHDRLCGLYADPARSRLRVTIRPEMNALTLHATVGGKGWNLPRLPDAERKLDRAPGGARPDR